MATLHCFVSPFMAYNLCTTLKPGKKKKFSVLDPLQCTNQMFTNDADFNELEFIQRTGGN